MTSHRPPRDVLRVCAEIEGAGSNSVDCTVYAAEQIVALRRLVKLAQGLVSAETSEGSVWLAEVKRRSTKGKSTS